MPLVMIPTQTILRSLTTMLSRFKVTVTSILAINKTRDTYSQIASSSQLLNLARISRISTKSKLTKSKSTTLLTRCTLSKRKHHNKSLTKTPNHIQMRTSTNKLSVKTMKANRSPRLKPTKVRGSRK